MRSELYAQVSGFVQGVFFRRTVFRHAESLGLVGYVCNLPDGTVEIVAQGEKEILKRFIDLVQEKPGQAKIEEIKARYSSPKGSYNAFEVRWV